MAGQTLCSIPCDALRGCGDTVRVMASAAPETVFRRNLATAQEELLHIAGCLQITRTFGHKIRVPPDGVPPEWSRHLPARGLRNGLSSPAFVEVSLTRKQRGVLDSNVRARTLITSTG
jgi:hypothetical protein